MNLGYLLGFPIILDLRALIDHRSSEYPDFTTTHVPLWQWFEGKRLFSDLVRGKYRPGGSCGGCIPQPRPRDNGLFSSYSHAICRIVARLPAEGDARHPRVSAQLGMLHLERESGGTCSHLTHGKDLCVKAEEGTGELPASPSYTYAWVSSSRLEDLISDHVLSVY